MVRQILDELEKVKSAGVVKNIGCDALKTADRILDELGKSNAADTANKSPEGSDGSARRVPPTHESARMSEQVYCDVPIGGRSRDFREFDDAIDFDEQLRWNESDGTDFSDDKKNPGESDSCDNSGACGGDEAVSTRSDFEERVYGERAIIFTADNIKNCTPPEYLKMRRLDNGSAAYFSGVKLFYKQAKFMESFEDDFSENVPFVSAYPTYNSMTTAQLRSYFTWRAKVKHGAAENFPLSYVRLYCFELINLIGADSPRDAFDKMKSILEKAGAAEGANLSDEHRWLGDMAVYYGIEPYFPGYDRREEALARLILLEAKTAGDNIISDEEREELFGAVCTLSGYKIANSAFYKKHEADVRRVVTGAVLKLIDYYRDSGGAVRCLFGDGEEYGYAMFDRAVFYERERHADTDYIINSYRSYKCRRGFWYESFACGRKTKSKALGAFIKRIDALMREKYNYKPSLGGNEPFDGADDIIRGETEALFLEKRKSRRESVSIDFSKLEAIRLSSLETQAKLTVEEDFGDCPEGDAATAESVPAKSKMQEAPLAGKTGDAAVSETISASETTSTSEALSEETPLGAEEREYLRLLLDGRDASEYLRSRGILESVMADGINEKLFELFGDSVIDCAEKAEIVEDYRSELEELTL